MKKILLVAGMHRSGTSLLSSVLSDLGFSLPKTMGESGEDNPEGFFEPKRIVELHDEVLSRNNLAWDSIEFIPEEWFESEECREYVSKLEKIIRDEYDIEQFILVKDPRLSKVIPLWRKLEESYGYELKVLVSKREPYSIAKSLLNRNGINVEKGVILSLSYLYNIRKDIKNTPYSTIRFPDFTQDIGIELKRVSKELDMPELLFKWNDCERIISGKFKSTLVHSKNCTSLLDDTYDSSLNQSSSESERTLKIFEYLSEVTLVPNLRNISSKFDVPDCEIEATIQRQLSELEQTQNTLRLQQEDNILLRERIDYLLDLSPKAVLKKSKAVIRHFYIMLYRKAGIVARRAFSQKGVDFLVNLLPNSMRPHASHYSPYLNQIDSKGLPNIDKKNRKNVFIFSIIDWNFRTQRPQHLAKYLSQLGCRVFYIEMSQQGSLCYEEIEQDLYRVRLGNLGNKLDSYSGIAEPNLIDSWISQFSQLCSILGAGQKEAIVQHPFWWQFVKHLSPEVKVTFDCMDDISAFSNTERHIIDWEHELIENCDELVVSSEHLQNTFSKKSHLIRNATELSHFTNISASSSELIEGLKNNISKSNAKIHIGYVGALDYWFDWKLVKNVANARKDIFFHIAGGVTFDEISELRQLSNVVLYGEIPYQLVPEFNNEMDILTIPFKIVPIIEACDPVKIYEYSALGKPTITTRLPELQRVEDLVFFASTVDEFISQVDNAYQQSRNDGFRYKLIEFASNNTWMSRAKDFFEVINRYSKVSVVVLSYKNPNLTINCLESLVRDGGTYPNLEIILVDNNSGLETVDKLKQYINTAPLDINLIENCDNYGFAKGNNIGIEAATGDYILLLNNDTYVSSGAIFAMTRHFSKRDVGIVGALTNNIGNEAKVDIEYDSMEEMLDASRMVTHGYRGVSTKVNVSAYFAVMFKAEHLKHVGLISEDYGRGMFEDDDHCKQFNAAGYEVVLAEDAFIHHELSVSFDQLGEEKKRLFDANKRIYENKWGTWQPHSYRTNRPVSTIEVLK